MDEGVLMSLMRGGRREFCRSSDSGRLWPGPFLVNCFVSFLFNYCLFLAVLGLRCCPDLFWLRRTGFSLWRLLLSWSTRPRARAIVVAPAVQHEGSSQTRDQTLKRQADSFFFFLCWIIFNWTIIALRCCVGFCRTSTWISHRYTYVPSCLPPASHPIPLL